MAVNLSFIGGAGWQFFTDDGVPLSGGKIYTYAAGTTTPQTTYTSRDGLTANANPIILDAAGRTPQQIWSTEGLLYKYVVKDASDVQIRSWDNVGGSVVASDLAQDLSNTTNNAKGDALVGFRQAGISGFLTGAVPSTVHSKLMEFVSVRDFGAVGDGITDDTAAIQAALTAAKNVVFPGGYTFFVAGTLNVTQANATVCIEGSATVYHAGTGTKCFNITGANATVCGDGTLYSYGIQDPTNSPITYAAIWVSGEGCVIRDIRIQRVTRCGIYLNDVGFATIEGITIDGEYNTAGWSAVDTVLFGVFADPNTTPSQGQLLVSSCKFTRLVSGVGVGNYGPANDGRGVTISSNLFTDCADHGVYLVATKGSTISANSFDRCGSAVALDGRGHVVVGNTITNFGPARSIYDKVSISMRDAISCAVSDNTLIGPYGAQYSGIDLSNVSGTEVSYNTVQGNVVINTSSVQGRMFIIGSATLTETMIGNVVTGNVFKGPGRNNEAVATFATRPTFFGVNNVFSNNVVHSTNQWRCLTLARQRKMTVHGNKFIWEYAADAPAIYDVVFISEVTLSTFRSNSLSVTGGANVTIRGITSSSSNSNWYTENQSTLTDSSVAAATPVFNSAVSDRVINNTWNINRIESTAAPTTGTWALGDVVYNTNPTSGGYFGWVCTAAGTPGTWRTFGLIS